MRLADWAVTWHWKLLFIASCAPPTNGIGAVVPRRRAHLRRPPAIRQRPPIKSGRGTSRTWPCLCAGSITTCTRSRISTAARPSAGRSMHIKAARRPCELLQRSVIGESCRCEPLVLHSDNGAPIRSVTMLTNIYKLVITPSRSRPRVSYDYPYSGSLLSTLKYSPQWPKDGCDDVEAGLGEHLMHW